jgi:hypothetical protein
MKYLIILLFLVSQCLHVQAQQGKIQYFNSDQLDLDSLVKGLGLDINSLEEYVQQNQELPAEKVFLHLDRPFYLQGDTIWFKAYLWYGYDQVPDTLSGILYVDLVGSRGEVIRQRKLQIQNGTANGDFILDSAITSGSYSLRACTRRMYNSNAGEIFFQTINVFPAGQNFHIECIPAIQKQTGHDSLQLRLKFFEIDPSGNLDSSISHHIYCSLDVREQKLYEGSFSLKNTREQIIKVGISSLSTLDSLADLTISVQDERMEYENQFHIPLQETIDLQFFPEGGNLVEGLESKVAFKAIGPDGLGRDVSGEIRTDKDEHVTVFSSIHNGMGTLLLQPESGKHYFAHLWFNKRKYIVPLPVAMEEGLVMSVTHLSDGTNPILTIKGIPTEVPESKYIVGSAYGKICFSAFVKAFQDSSRIQIPVDLLPEGICRLTVLNASFQGESERLIYVDKSEGLTIEAIPDSSIYETRSMVRLQIEAYDQTGRPVQTDLSLAVLDKGQIGPKVQFTGIHGYKLLESELRGSIEDPGFFFEDGVCVHKEALDVLLLTQGYRKFVQADAFLNGGILKPEKSDEITGRIEIDGNASRKKKFDYRKVNLTLMCNAEDYFFFRSSPDSLGRFRFQLPPLHGNIKFFMQAASSRNKTFKGKIFLDDPVPPPHFYTFRLPAETLLPAKEEVVFQMQSRQKAEHSKPAWPDSIAWSQSLDEVTVTAKAKNWYNRHVEDASRIIYLDSLDPEGNKYDNLNDLLVNEFGASWITGGYFRTVQLPATRTSYVPLNRFGLKSRPRIVQYPPIYVIDGNVFWNGEGYNFWPLLPLGEFPVNEIKRILVFPPMSTGTNYYASSDLCDYPEFIQQSMVVIETYSKTYRGDPLGSKTFIRHGLDTPREFYSPQYVGSSRQNPQYDGRVTLYWNPSIRTDEGGHAEVEFYTSDRQTDLEVIVNGMNVESGFTGEARSQIEVFDN